MYILCINCRARQILNPFQSRKKNKNKKNSKKKQQWKHSSISMFFVLFSFCAFKFQVPQIGNRYKRPLPCGFDPWPVYATPSVRVFIRFFNVFYFFFIPLNVKCRDDCITQNNNIIRMVTGSNTVCLFFLHNLSIERVADGIILYVYLSGQWWWLQCIKHCFKIILNAFEFLSL